MDCPCISNHSPKNSSISNRIQSRYVLQLTIGLASFRGFTCKSKNLGLLNLSFDFYQRSLKMPIWNPWARICYGGFPWMHLCSTGARSILIVYEALLGDFAKSSWYQNLNLGVIVLWTDYCLNCFQLLFLECNIDIYKLKKRHYIKLFCHNTKSVSSLS